MATYTNNLNLKKPSTGEKYDVIGDLNDAKDKIDTHAGAVNAQLAQTSNNVWFNNYVNTKTGTTYIAHRGLSYLAPENTIPAFELAGAHGFWGIETDIQPTSDGKLIVMHDIDVDRMTDGTGKVIDLTYETIQSLTIDSGRKVDQYPQTKIPTFEDYLSVCKKYGCYALVEMKWSENFTDDDIDNMLDIINKHDMVNKTFIIHSLGTVIDTVASKQKNIGFFPIAAATQENINHVKSLGNAVLFSSDHNTTLPNIERTHKSGVRFATYTIDDQTRANQIIKYGVDFIITNRLIGV